MASEDYVKTWRKRIDAAKETSETWLKEYRVKECYDYWRGQQRVEEFDEFGVRRAIVNKIHPEIRNNLPSLYFYRPYAKLQVEPERADDPGSTIEEQTQLLEDTVNHLIRDKETCFRDATMIALKEAHWALGVVEVGYSAEFVDAPNAKKPPLKEDDKTKGEGKVEGDGAYGAEAKPTEPVTDSYGLTAGPDSDAETMAAEIDRLKGELKTEKFYVKHIPSKQFLISCSDKPMLYDNDWVGYWEDMPIEDVKRSSAYKNTKGLKATAEDPDRAKEKASYEEKTGSPESIRLFKIWDLRSGVRYVFAESHDKCLLQKRYKRCPIKVFRFEVDPYHFLPRPPIYSKLGPQDEYNDSREYLRKVRKGTVPRYTYDEDAVESSQMRKLESGDMGTYIPRKAGTANVIEPVNQPSFSENAVQTLTLSDKEFSDVGGVGGDARIAQTKTATQAKISESKAQAQDSFDRTIVADFLADVAQELLALAIDHMSVDRIIAMNIPADSMFYPQLAMDIGQQFQKINAQKLQDASNGFSWTVIVDIDSLSPVAEDQKLERWMKGVELLSNPQVARLFSVAPPFLKHTLELLGMRGAKEQGMMSDALQAVVQMEQQLAAQGQNTAQGIPSSAKSQPNQPQPPAPGGAQ